MTKEVQYVKKFDTQNLIFQRSIARNPELKEFWDSIKIAPQFFERVAKIHEKMKELDNHNFGIALRNIAKSLYKEILGSTAIRKSSKIRDITDEFGKRIQQVTDKDDMVNYIYFMIRLYDFDLANRVDSKLRNELIERGIATTVKHAHEMEFENVLRIFADITQIDPALPLANKLTDMIKDGNIKLANKESKTHEEEMNHSFRLLRYIYRSKNPRLYQNLAKTVVHRLAQQPWKQESNNGLIFMFNTIVHLEKSMYQKFDILNDYKWEILQRRQSLSHSNVVKIMEGVANLSKYGGALALAAPMQNLVYKNFEKIIGLGKQEDLTTVKITEDNSVHLFLLRFWSLFMSIQDSEKFINEDLLKKSLDIVRIGLSQQHQLANAHPEKALTERDFRNVTNIVDFCYRNEQFPSIDVLKGILDELMIEYDRSAFKFKTENQEHFIGVARKIFKNDQKRLERMADISLRYIKTEATNLKFLCNGLEIFEALDIVKHETRRHLLGRIKSTIQNDEFKVKDLLYLIQLYPNKIRTKAFEQLVDLALQKVISKNLLPNVEQQIQLLIQLSKAGVSAKVRSTASPFMTNFLKRNDHSNKLLNQALNHFCMNFKNLDATNHVQILHFLSRQKELFKTQREMVYRYIAMAVSETNYTPLEEPLVDDIKGCKFSSQFEQSFT